MSLEEIQMRFENALGEFNEESDKIGCPQKSVTCNEHGVFIDFAGVEINYSLYSLEDNLEDYLAKQVEKHESYRRVLQGYKLQTKKELQRYDNFFYSIFQRISKPSQKELLKTIGQERVKLAFDKVIREGALLGKYFFEEIAADYTKNRSDEPRRKLVQNTANIYEIAKDIELLDAMRLTYFRTKELQWYGNTQFR